MISFKKLVEIPVVIALYVYYFFEVGKRINFGYLPVNIRKDYDKETQEIVAQIFYTFAAPFVDIYFWILNLLYHLAHIRELEEHLRTLSSFMNVGEQWSSTGLKLYIIFAVVLEMMIFLHNNNSKK